MPRSTKNCLRTEPPAAEDYSGRQRTAGGGGRLREPGARGTKGRAPEAGGKRRGARAGGLGGLGSRLPRCVAPRSGGAVRGARAPAAAITAQHARVLGAPEDEATARGYGGAAAPPGSCCPPAARPPPSAALPLGEGAWHGGPRGRGDAPGRSAEAELARLGARGAHAPGEEAAKAKRREGRAGPRDPETVTRKRPF